MQPAQQQGLRFPSSSSVTVRFIWFFLVSCFLTVIVQQIHSFRASGVKSSHFSKTDSSDARAFFKSSGISCATPPVIFFFAIRLYYIKAYRDELQTQESFIRMVWL